MDDGFSTILDGTVHVFSPNDILHVYPQFESPGGSGPGGGPTGIGTGERSAMEMLLHMPTFGPVAGGELRRAFKGIYTSPDQYGQMQHGMSPAIAYGGGAAPSFDQYHTGQVQLHNILQSNPQIVSQIFSTLRMPPTAQVGLAGGTRGLPARQVT